LDYTPSIGRGYSQTSQTFYSTCQRVTGSKILPTFDYDFNIMFITSSEEANRIIPSAFGNALSFSDITSQVTFATGSSNSRYLNIVVLMMIDRYYDTQYDVPEIKPQARTMLDRGDIVGFLHVCGPRYISSIRKRGELVSLFHTEVAIDDEPTPELRDRFYQTLGSTDVDFSDTNFNSYFARTTVQIKGYGLRRVEKDDYHAVLVPMALKHFGKVLNYGFDSLRHTDAGLIYSAAVTSWTTHFDFQAAVGLDTNLEYEVCYDSDQNVIPCDETLGLPASTEINTLTPSVQRMTFMVNAEFLLSLESIVQKKMSTLYKLSRCTNALRSYNECNVKKLLRHLNYDMADGEHGRTAQDVLTQLEAVRQDLPPQRRSLIGRKSQAIMDYVTHYYAPCVDQLTSDNLGVVSGSMLTRLFLTIPECQDTTCSLDNSVYDTNAEQCVSSIPGAAYELTQCNRHSRPTDGLIWFESSSAYSSPEGCHNRCAGMGYAYFSLTFSLCACHNAIGHQDADYFPCEDWCYGDRSNYPRAEHSYPYQYCTFTIKQRSALRQCNSHARPTDGNIDFDQSEEYSTHEACRSRCIHLGYTFFSRNDNNCGCHNDIGHPDAEIIPCGQYCYGDRDNFPITDHSYRHVYCTSAILPNNYETNAVDHVLDEFCMPQILNERPFIPCRLRLLPGEYLKPGEYVCNDRVSPTQRYGLNARGEVVRRGYELTSGGVGNELYTTDIPTPYMMLGRDQRVLVYSGATNAPQDGYGCNNSWDQTAGIPVSTNTAEEDCEDNCHFYISWLNNQICIRNEDGECLVNLELPE